MGLLADGCLEYMTLRIKKMILEREVFIFLRIPKYARKHLISEIAHWHCLFLQCHW